MTVNTADMTPMERAKWIAAGKTEKARAARKQLAESGTTLTSLVRRPSSKEAPSVLQAVLAWLVSPAWVSETGADLHAVLTVEDVLMAALNVVYETAEGTLSLLLRWGDDGLRVAFGPEGHAAVMASDAGLLVGELAALLGSAVPPPADDPTPLSQELVGPVLDAVTGPDRVRLAGVLTRLLEEARR